MDDPRYHITGLFYREQIRAHSYPVHGPAAFPLAVAGSYPDKSSGQDLHGLQLQDPGIALSA